MFYFMRAVEIIIPVNVKLQDDDNYFRGAICIFKNHVLPDFHSPLLPLYSSHNHRIEEDKLSSTII